MDILKCISLLSISILLISCKKNTYKKSNESFQVICLKNWESDICPKKVVLERYNKKTYFKELIDKNSDFEIEDCEPLYASLKQRTINPNVPYLGKINYDIRLIIDDSLEYKITEIQNKVDTVFAGGKGNFVIMNNIKSFVVNGHKLDNKNAPLSIEIPTKLGKTIKKK